MQILAAPHICIQRHNHVPFKSPSKEYKEQKNFYILSGGCKHCFSSLQRKHLWVTNNQHFLEKVETVGSEITEKHVNFPLKKQIFLNL